MRGGPGLSPGEEQAERRLVYSLPPTIRQRILRLHPPPAPQNALTNRGKDPNHRCCGEVWIRVSASICQRILRFCLLFAKHFVSQGCRREMWI